MRLTIIDIDGNKVSLGTGYVHIVKENNGLVDICYGSGYCDTITVDSPFWKVSRFISGFYGDVKTLDGRKKEEKFELKWKENNHD